MKILHIITGLSTGGAEMMLYKLLSRCDRAVFENTVISLTDVGEVGEKIKALGVQVESLGMGKGLPNPYRLFRLTGRLRSLSPHLVQTWMYHSDLIGGIAAKLAGSMPVVWGVRHSNLDPACNKAKTVWTAKVCARLSRFLPVHIIYCSAEAKRVHTELGYAADHTSVIPNGFDLGVFKPDNACRISLRQELGVSSEALLVGLIGRFHPQKDHANFVQAASRLAKLFPDVHFVLCGRGVDRENKQLVKWIEEAGVQARCHLLGQREDVAGINAALDVATSSSRGEGFPNVIGEAMACGIPCVVTDVGDSAWLVGETGVAVPSQNPEELANGCKKLLILPTEERQKLGRAARKRIEEHFSIDRVVKQYQDLYKNL